MSVFIGQCDCCGITDIPFIEIYVDSPVSFAESISLAFSLRQELHMIINSPTILDAGDDPLVKETP